VLAVARQMARDFWRAAMARRAGTLSRPTAVAKTGPRTNQGDDSQERNLRPTTEERRPTRGARQARSWIAARTEQRPSMTQPGAFEARDAGKLALRSWLGLGAANQFSGKTRSPT